MISVGVKELKAKLSSYMRLVRKGEEVIVTDHGREVALVIPISKERQVIKSLMDSGKAKWSGGKPAGLKGVKAKGKAMSTTVLEERR